MEPRGLRKVGVATLIVGLALGLIVPFATFGGKFPGPWVLGVSVLPLLWAAIWTYRARRRSWWVVLLGQWATLVAACWLFLGDAAGWPPQAALGGVIFGTLLLAVWMVPVAIIAAFPASR